MPIVFTVGILKLSSFKNILFNGGIIMKNVDLKVKDNKLTIVVDLTKEFGKSSSGKSTMIASTEGNQALPGMEDVKIGLNVYRK
jgi:ABC-type polar amino acid transport system ATPase subunit